jgi:ABC-type sugar transport system ATPase subunit
MTAALQEAREYRTKAAGIGTAIASLHGASKNFGEVQALRQVNFAVRAGELVALLGGKMYG